MKPKISIVMAVYNAHPYINIAVESIVNQDYGNFEFIIVDDCSTDKSWEFLSYFKDSRIKLYRNSRNVGLTRSLSRAMEYVTAPFVARMDADDFSEQHRLSTQYAYMVKNNLTLCGSDAQIIDDNGKLLKVKRRLQNHIEIAFYTLLNNPFMHTSVMFKKDCYDFLNGYNNRVKYAQDYQLWARWVQQFRVGNVNESLVKWRQSRKGISTTHTNFQKVSADAVCIRYVRSVFPELEDVSDGDIVSMRNSKFNAGNIDSIDKIFNSAQTKFDCKYVRSWVAQYRARTSCFRKG